MQGTTSNKLHDDSQFGRSLAGPQEQDHVGMTETVHNKHFPLECLHGLWSGPSCAEQLEGGGGWREMRYLM